MLSQAEGSGGRMVQCVSSAVYCAALGEERRVTTPTHPPPITSPASRCRCRPQDLQVRGRDVLLPVGCSDFDEWLLDALSVERLLKQLKSGAPTLDLINACISTSTSAAARKDYLSTPPRGTTTGGEDGGIVDFRTLISGDATPSAVAAAADAAAAAEQDSHLPQLRLKSLQVGGYSARLLWWSGQASPCLRYQCTAAAAGHVRQAWFRWRVPCPLPLLLL